MSGSTSREEWGFELSLGKEWGKKDSPIVKRWFFLHCICLLRKKHPVDSGLAVVPNFMKHNLILFVKTLPSALLPIKSDNKMSKIFMVGSSVSLLPPLPYLFFSQIYFFPQFFYFGIIQNITSVIVTKWDSFEKIYTTGRLIINKKKLVWTFFACLTGRPSAL